MTAYKVFLRLRNGSLKSAGELHHTLRNTYDRNRINYPKIKGSKFFVFKDKEEAETFRTQVSSCYGKKGKYLTGVKEVWEVDVPSLTEQVGRTPVVWNYNDDLDLKAKKISVHDLINAVSSFWTRGSQFIMDTAGTTPNAYTTKSVRLVKKVS